MSSVCSSQNVLHSKVRETRSRDIYQRSKIIDELSCTEAWKVTYSWYVGGLLFNFARFFLNANCSVVIAMPNKVSISSKY